MNFPLNVLQPNISVDLTRKCVIKIGAFDETNRPRISMITGYCLIMFW